jgi:hypothetical protein
MTMGFGTSSAATVVAIFALALLPLPRRKLATSI